MNYYQEKYVRKWKVEALNPQTKLYLLPEVGGHILSRGEERMPSPLAQSRPVEWQSAEANDRNVNVHHTWQQGLSCKWKVEVTKRQTNHLYESNNISI